MAKGTTVGRFDPANLSQLLGESLEIRRSGREGAKYPLYLSTKVGPVPLNTRAAQDFLLEHGEFSQQSAQEEPEPVPGEIPEETSEPESEEPKRKRGFLESFFSGDEDE